MGVAIDDHVSLSARVPFEKEKMSGVIAYGLSRPR